MLFGLYWSFFKVLVEQKIIFEYTIFRFADFKNHIKSDKKHVFTMK